MPTLKRTTMRRRCTLGHIKLKTHCIATPSSVSILCRKSLSRETFGFLEPKPLQRDVQWGKGEGRLVLPNIAEVIHLGVNSAQHRDKEEISSENWLLLPVRTRCYWAFPFKLRDFTTNANIRMFGNDDPYPYPFHATVSETVSTHVCRWRRKGA